MGKDKVLGIDLGTTNSGMAVFEGGDPQMLQNAESERLTSSVVSFKDDDSVVVGKSAEHRAAAEPDRTFREVKLDIGTGTEYEVDGKTYTPADISAEILKKLREDSAEPLGDEVKKAVITVPAYFTADQKTATRKAGEAAGFEDIELINEPSAAALAHGHENELEDHTLLVYDFGGGTLDTSLLEITDDEYTVLTTTGNNELGGSDFTRAIMEELASRYEDENGVHLLDDIDDSEIEENLRDASEAAKITLSSQKEAEIKEPFLGSLGEGEIVSVETTLTRSTFENITEDLLEEARKPIEQVKKDVEEVGNSDIDEVLLVGGSTHIPSVKDMVADETGTEPTTTFDPDKIVAQGAAVYAVESSDLGFGDIVYVCDESGQEFDTRKALRQYQIRNGYEGWTIKDTETGEEYKDRDDLEDEKRETTDKTLKEIVTRSLGTGVKGGEMAVHLEKGTPIDEARETKYYTTTRPDQTVIPVNAHQGESDSIRDNEELEEFSLSGLDPMDAGDPIVEVTFWVDDDGVLNVEAVDITDGEGGEREQLTVDSDPTGSKS